MKKGKLILSSATLLITIGHNLAFKVAKKFGSKLAYVQVTPTTCHQCINAWTYTPGVVSKCQTQVAGPFHLGGGPNHRKFFRTSDTPQTTCLVPTRASIIL